MAKKAKFSKGQHVILKKDGRHIIINGIVKEGNEILYRSSRLPDPFHESEVVDFYTYWRRNKIQLRRRLRRFNKGGYPWQYCSLGGNIRVKISSGEDIAHLRELDQKLWTVLACPVDGLEFDRKTLRFLDADGDGKIRIPEVIDAAEWITGLIKDRDLLLNGECEVPISEIDTEDENGARLEKAARQLVRLLNLKKESFSEDDIIAAGKIFADNEDILPFGANTAAALQACEAIDGKVRDFFSRCKLIAFHGDVAAAVDVSAEKIGALVEQGIGGQDEAIAQLPISRPNAEGTLPFSGINPSWLDAFNKAKGLVLNVLYPGKTGITEADWNAAISKFGAYKEWVGQKGEDETETHTAVRASLRDLDKLVHYYHHFYNFLCNYVVFKNFYSLDPNDKAMFVCGELYIDQRCCSLCVRVEDMGAHADIAALSGMYLLYCTCVSKKLGKTMDIVAVLTSGEVFGLRPGLNAIFYDREGNDYSAVVTKIVDNPISVRQAFFSPYRKFANFIAEKISKSAADKEAKVADDLKKAAEQTPTVTETPDGKKVNATVPFDIAKFAGIFAAIGLAIGFITEALVKAIAGITKTAGSDYGSLKILGIIAGLMLCISGPSMFLAWLKLRKRNLGPILNANGWAINARAIVNIKFGATLTSLAQYPKIRITDPFTTGKFSFWKFLFALIIVLVVVFAVLYFRNKLGIIGLPYNGCPFCK